MITLAKVKNYLHQTRPDSDKVDDIVKKLEKLDKVIDKNYMEEVDEEALVEGIYKGYVAGLGDPYSSISRQEYKDLMNPQVVFTLNWCQCYQDITTGIIKIVNHLYLVQPMKRVCFLKIFSIR